MMQMYLLGPVPVFHCLTTQLHLQLLLNGLQDIRSIVQTFQQQYQQLLCRALVEKSTLEMSGKSPFFVWRLLFFCIFCLTLLSLLPMNLYLFRSARVSFLHVWDAKHTKNNMASIWVSLQSGYFNQPEVKVSCVCVCICVYNIYGNCWVSNKIHNSQPQVSQLTHQFEVTVHWVNSWASKSHVKNQANRGRQVRSRNSHIVNLPPLPMKRDLECLNYKDSWFIFPLNNAKSSQTCEAHSTNNWT